jgi:hypothetical protein
MGGSGYIYKSVDSGENWSPANNGLPSSDKFVLTFNDLIIDQNNPATLYAAVRFNKFCVCLDGENNGVFKTTDGGANWKQISNIKISALAIDRKSPALLYAVGGGRVLMSSNGGVSWRSVANEPLPVAAKTLLINPTSADSLYVGTTGGGVYKFTGAPVTSTDCLFNWAETNYADLFAPASPGSAVSDIYSYRYYSTSNTYLGVSSANNHVYFIGLDGIFQDQGSQWDWLPKAGCPVPDAQRDCVFSWAEKNYPGLFAPAAVSTNQTGVYTYRYYPATKTYLGVSSLDSHIYYLAADGNLQDEGLFYNWLDPSSCQ